MNSIGFRAGSKEVFYIVVEGTTSNPKIITKGTLKHPIAFDMPDALCWYRNQISALCSEFSAAACGIRTAEPESGRMGGASKEGAAKRRNIEGVLMESTRSIGLKVVFGPLATISSLLATKGAKKYIGATDFRGMDGWEELNSNLQEAALAAVAALGGFEE